MIIYTHPIAENLPIKNLVARRLHGNKYYHAHTHAYHTHVHAHTLKHTHNSAHTSILYYKCTKWMANGKWIKELPGHAP